MSHRLHVLDRRPRAYTYQSGSGRARGTHPLRQCEAGVCTRVRGVAGRGAYAVERWRGASLERGASECTVMEYRADLARSRVMSNRAGTVGGFYDSFRNPRKCLIVALQRNRDLPPGPVTVHPATDRRSWGFLLRLVRSDFAPFRNNNARFCKAFRHCIITASRLRLRYTVDL
jgi:hypothetical protein